MRAEIDTFVSQRLEKLVADMDFVPREEFEAVKAMAAKARAENEALAARIAALEQARSKAIASRIDTSPALRPVGESNRSHASLMPPLRVSKLWNLCRARR